MESTEPQQPSDPPQTQQSTTAQPPTKTRKRARKACLACRARKVRCDVSQRGRPCMNCYLDNEACIVTGRASKDRLVQYDFRDGVQATLPPYMPINLDFAGRHEENTSERAGLSHNLVRDEYQVDATTTTTEETLFAPDNNSNHLESSAADGAAQGTVAEESGSQAHLDQSQQASGAPPLSLHNLSSSMPNIETPVVGHSTSPPEIVYSYYPCLIVSNLSSLPHQDVNFLDLHGCLRVPVRPILDELINQYFLHVHPILPLLNEGDFWYQYYHSDEAHPRNQIPLLLLQAMLFASCTFISEATVAKMGYRDIRCMRAALLKRAKLLYDLDTESSALAIAQATLLLSLTSLSSTRKPNTVWLNLAIEHAKQAEAHLYATMTASRSLDNDKRSTLKKVWWCCIIRDRSMGLLMRRPIQISHVHFDFAVCPLVPSDFEDEFERSRVYNPTTKRRIADILGQMVQLCVILTDVLTLVFPLDGSQGLRQQGLHNSSQKVRACKMALKRWYESASQEVSPQNTLSLGSRVTTDQDVHHDSTILYTHLMYMYYHTSRIVLCHHEVLHLETLQTVTNTRSSIQRDLPVILENRHELRDATSNIIDCHKELVCCGLARWLPISAIGLTALPLVLNVLDMKLSPPAKDSSDPSSALKQHQLNVLIQVMKIYWPQYDGVDWISDIVRHIVGLAQLDDVQLRHRESSIDWTDVFAFQPGSYLRLALALDLSLNKGRFPQDVDFPLGLRGLFSVECSPLKDLVETTSRRSDASSKNNDQPSLDSPRRRSPTPDPISPDQLDHFAFAFDESLIETLEEEIYLHLAGALSSSNIPQPSHYPVSGGDVPCNDTVGPNAGLGTTTGSEDFSLDCNMRTQVCNLSDISMEEGEG